MTTGTAASLRGIVREAAKVDRSGFEIGFAVRCTVGVAIPLVLGALLGAPLAGVSAAYGALVTGFASRSGRYRTRAAAMILTALALAGAGLAGTLTAAHPLANLLVAIVLAALFGFGASLGRAAMTGSINGIVAFLLFSNPPYDLANPWVQSAMVVAGGVLQTLLLVLVWPLQRFRIERHALAAAYRALAVYAGHVNADDLGLPEADSLGEVRAALADPQPFGSRNELAALQVLADEAERLRASLAALTSDHHLLAEVGMSSAAAAVGDVATRAQVLLADLAEALDRGLAPPPARAAWSAFGRAVLAVEASTAPGAVSIEDVRTLAGKLRAAWRATAVASTTGIAGDTRAAASVFALPAFGDALETLRANCSPRSIFARHALRIAVAIGVAIVIQRLLPLAHGAWIGLTVALVLRPDFSSTFTRGFARIFGTIGGAMLASLVAVLHPADLGYLALAVLFAGIGFAVFNASYAAFSAAITGYVVYVLAFGGSPEHASAIDRVIATAIGGLLALAAYTVWPTWARERVADDLAALLEAQSRLCSLVLHAFVSPQGFDAAAARAAQLATRGARSNAESSVDQMKGEPVEGRRLPLAVAQGILAASRRIGVAVLALQARIGQPAADAPRASLERLIAGLERSIALLAGALRARTPAPPIPPLGDEQIALARQAAADPAAHWEIVVSETDLLVDSVNTIADLLRMR